MQGMEDNSGRQNRLRRASIGWRIRRSVAALIPLLAGMVAFCIFMQNVRFSGPKDEDVRVGETSFALCGTARATIANGMDFGKAAVHALAIAAYSPLFAVAAFS